MYNNDLIKIQSSLQNQANEILKKFGLIDLLSKYGNPIIVGSLALGLMTWEDIDIDLEVDKNFNDSSYFEIVQYFFKQNNIKQVILIDNRKELEPGRPRSMYIGIIFEDSAKTSWKIDIRILSANKGWAQDDIDKIKSRLTPLAIENILKIKKDVAKHPKYRKEISSIDIYTAVLDKDVKDLDGFKKYISEKGVPW